MDMMKTNVSTETQSATFTIGELEVPGKLTLKNVNVSVDGETCITDAVMSLQAGLSKTILESSWFGHLFMVLATKADRLIELLLSGIALSLEREKFKFEQEKAANKDKEKEETEEEKPATEE